jgi:hypothetical protein
MKARSVVVGALAAGVMVVGGAGSASANIAWCMADPPVQVQTPAGANMTVNLTVSVNPREARFIKNVVSTSVTQPDGAGGTLITVRVAVPATITVAHVTASVSRYTISDSATVLGGSSTTLHLDVPAS